jgi:hypothetical protein
MTVVCAQGFSVISSAIVEEKQDDQLIRGYSLHTASMVDLCTKPPFAPTLSRECQRQIIQSIGSTTYQIVYRSISMPGRLEPYQSLPSPDGD